MVIGQVVGVFCEADRRGGRDRGPEGESVQREEGTEEEGRRRERSRASHAIKGNREALAQNT